MTNHERISFMKMLPYELLSLVINAYGKDEIVSAFKILKKNLIWDLHACFLVQSQSSH